MLRNALFALYLTFPLAGCEALVLGSVAASCSTQATPELLPERLPIAKVGVPYNVPLEVIRTSSPVHGIYASDKHPLPEGLRIEHQDRDSHGFITGTPVKAGSYQLQMSAGTYGTQCTGLRASRVYTLKVTE